MLTEYEWGERIEPPNPEIANMSKLAEAIMKERPHFVLVADTHISPETQNVAASLVESLANDPLFKPGDVGFYVEALFSSARPKYDDDESFSGNVIMWDKYERDALYRTNYKETIQKAIKSGIPVHGIDFDRRLASGAEERVEHWKQKIFMGAEPIKVLLVGSGHMWNDPAKPDDLMSRLGHNQWAILNENAYIPPDHSQVVKANISESVSTTRKYNVAKYNLPHDSRFSRRSRQTPVQF